MLTSMAPRFQEKGIVCDVVALQDTSSPLAAALQDSGVSLRYTGVERLYSPKQIFALTDLLRGYDIVHVHLFPAQLWTVLAVARAGRIPLVTTEHNTWNARRRWWLRPLDRWMYPHYERIVCISDATAECLIAWCPGIAGKTTVVANGIPLDMFENAQPAVLPSIPKDMIKLVFVGRCEAQKDHATILRAMPFLPRTHLLLVGGGPLLEQLKQMARYLKVEDRVAFLGWRQDVASVLKASDIYIHSTHSDGFGIAACEAMAAGLPVVVSDVPGLAQVVAGAGMLFPVGDEKALVQHLTSLIESPELRRKMSVASVQRARQFSIEKTVNGYLGIYESILRTGVRK